MPTPLFTAPREKAKIASNSGLTMRLLRPREEHAGRTCGTRRRCSAVDAKPANCRPFDHVPRTGVKLRRRCNMKPRSARQLIDIKALSVRHTARCRKVPPALGDSYASPGLVLQLRSGPRSSGPTLTSDVC